MNTKFDNSLFCDTTPVVVNLGNITTRRELIKITRPSRYSNPFRISSFFSERELVQCLGTVEWLRDLTLTDDFIKKSLPKCYEISKKRFLLTRTNCIEMFEELWEFGAQQGLISKEEILALEGKALGCVCYPKKCHGDVIVKYFNRIRGDTK